MFDVSTEYLATVVLTFFVAGVVKGVTGMGLPTVAMAVLGALISPLAAASLLILPSFVTNVWQMLDGPGLRPLLRRLWPMLLPAAAVTVPASAWIARGSAEIATGALGATLVVYAAYTLLVRAIRTPAALERWLSPVIGGATGAVAGGTGVVVVPALPYLQSLGFGRDELVQALGLSFTVSTVALAAGLTAHGAYDPGDVALSGLAILPALAGMRAGQAIRGRISPRAFRLGFLLCLLLLGGEMALRPLL